MSVSIQISPNPSLYIRDPQKTTMGRKILEHAISLMEETGLEKFTFRKLANSMDASEITIYRYFENKHKLLLYLLSWYWEWVKYSIRYNIQNLTDSREKLQLAIRTVIESNRRNALVEYIDEQKLYAIVIEESEKAYHTKFVDEENKKGLFLTLKALKTEIATIILEVNPQYAYANSLSSIILEMSASLRFFSGHLPSMTDMEDTDNTDECIYELLSHLVFSTLNDSGNS